MALYVTFLSPTHKKAAWHDWATSAPHLIHDMRIVNLSDITASLLMSWLPPDLAADTVIFLPDVCRARTPLPTGTVVITRDAYWYRHAASDFGCGMRLIRLLNDTTTLDEDAWEGLARRLHERDGKLGSLGSGNHFLEAMTPSAGGPLHFLLHCGSLYDSDYVQRFAQDRDLLEATAARLIRRGRLNRDAIHETIEKVFGPTELVLDATHNSIERLSKHTTIIRNGAAKVFHGDLHIIPSHMTGPAALVRVTDRVADLQYSLNHGTGKVFHEAAPDDRSTRAVHADAASPTSNVVVAGSRTRHRDYRPSTYRDLADCLRAIDDYVEVVELFTIVAHID